MSRPLLNTPVERFTRFLFGKVIERLAAKVNEEGLSFSQVVALHIIDSESEININNISKRLGLSMSATSRLIADLVKKRLILRLEDPNNRRAKIISLTKEGCRFMDDLSIERVKIVTQSTHVIHNKMSFRALKMVLGKDILLKQRKRT